MVTAEGLYFYYYSLAALCLVFFATKVLQYGIRPKTFPPGPPTLPLLGNLHQMPTKNFHLEFQKLAQQYGPITAMKLGGQNLFLLNDPTVVRDLIEKRSSNYSCRPDLYIRSFGDNLNIAFRDNDDIWRRQRKMYHVRLNVKSADRYLPYQAFDSLQLINDLAVRPEGWVQHVQRYTASISTALLYGWRTPATDTGYVKDLLEWMDVTSEAANFQLVDFYAFLRPLYHFLPYWMLPTSEPSQGEDRKWKRVSQFVNRPMEFILLVLNSITRPWFSSRKLRKKLKRKSTRSSATVDFQNGKTVWTLNHERFKESRSFNPMRQTGGTTLTENNAITQDSPRRLHFTFGAGRRVCPGFHVAERNLFLAISRILWGFTINPARDSMGTIVPINRDAVTPGLIVRPEDFECDIKPRSAGHKQVIMDLWSKAVKDLDSEGNFTPGFINSVFGKEK
ncbi:hypothetical protein CDV36_012048 [Fusarium kuroshium]|uniref:Cytochrome P450 n=1 Tax=Fusarium kuroshium TaxID=2010991 RepID=A0A3M2RSR5_9HYPO|nr:hypothetical protein CDV36_012048 [Fusarium kuroshium]